MNSLRLETNIQECTGNTNALHQGMQIHILLLGEKKDGGKGVTFVFLKKERVTTLF